MIVICLRTINDDHCRAYWTLFVLTFLRQSDRHERILEQQNHPLKCDHQFLSHKRRHIERNFV